MLTAVDNLFTVSVSAPGKVILHGEHSVVYGKTAIAVSLGLRSSIVIKEVNTPHEPAVHIHLPCVDLQETIPLEPTVKSLFHPKLAPGITGKFSWRLPHKIDHDYHLRRVEEYLHLIKPNFDSLPNNQKNSLRSFLYVFSGIFGSTYLPVKSMDISMGSELTIGAGTGSSASFAVCLAGALIQLLKLKSSSGNFDAYYDQSSQDFTDTEKEIISEWAFNCEKIMHGTPSGIDNATCTFGNLVSFKKGAKPRHLDIRMELRVLLVDSRVSRETRTLVVRVAALRQRNTAAVDHIMEACEHVAHTATQVLEKLSSGKCDPDTEADYQHLSELWDMNHCLLSALGVSHPSLEVIRAAAKSKGLACKLTGAGGGGYAMILIPPSTPRSTIDSLSGQLLQNGFRVTETRLGGPGVSIEM
ncbi:mevalonate kinase [Bombyx mandarina]|uniref:Mevalonate kinase n=2 Tax=Bombyx TaxID=7090 RepID=A0A8R2G9I5_BOMMO|nr:mevalonate kinase isoform X1 [Bombyx mori]XP_012548048.1 mevalonate kinase isoform X1 [Bombyx mori]XP_028028367.1 mevalonate kinase [Bombyx mandarina]XP_037872104.1 mevalonate kinase isoform X1 [Bombyx mori]